MKKKIVPLLVLAVLVAGGGYAYATRPDVGYWRGLAAEKVAAFGLDRLWTGDDRPAPLYGNVDIRQASLGFRVGGRLADVRVDEGDVVKAGDVLARLDGAPYRHAVESAAANVAGLRAALDKLIAGPRKSEIVQAEAALSQQQAALTNANLAFERARQLTAQGTVAQSVYDTASAERQVAAARMESARAALALLQEGSRVEDIAAARARLDGAQAALDSARLSLADTELRAPEDGIVLSRVSEPGAILGTGGTVFVLSLIRPVWVRAYIGETELGRIHPGLKVKVTADSIGAAYEGTVGYISPVAEFTPKTVETPDLRTDLVYRFRIIVTEPGADLRQGMPVTITLPSDGGAR